MPCAPASAGRACRTRHAGRRSNALTMLMKWVFRGPAVPAGKRGCCLPAGRETNRTFWPVLNTAPVPMWMVSSPLFSRIREGRTGQGRASVTALPRTHQVKLYCGRAGGFWSAVRRGGLGAVRGDPGRVAGCRSWSTRDDGQGSGRTALWRFVSLLRRTGNGSVSR